LTGLNSTIPESWAEGFEPGVGPEISTLTPPRGAPVSWRVTCTTTPQSCSGQCCTAPPTGRLFAVSEGMVARLSGAVSTRSAHIEVPADTLCRMELEEVGSGH